MRSSLLKSGRSVLDFSESNPTKVGFARPLALLDSENSTYRPDPKGSPRARQAISSDYAAKVGPKAPSPEAIFLCASTSEAYGWIFKLLCDPGDAVLVPKPGYPLFDYLAGLEAVEARPYRLEYVHPRGWSIDLDSLDSALKRGRARAIVLINPNNPTASYVRAEERAKILESCCRYGCSIIADEVFFGFPLETDEGSAAPASWVGEDACLCFTLDGLSKRLGMPQAKLGWIAASGPRKLLDEARGRLEIVADAYLSAGTPIMNALPAILAESEDFARPCRERCEANLATLRRSLEGPDSAHRVLRCEGGWTAIIESPRILPEEELALGLLREQGLWSHPGYLFDMEREAFFTVGLILPPEDLERGIESYLRYFDSLQVQ